MKNAIGLWICALGFHKKSEWSDFGELTTTKSEDCDDDIFHEFSVIQKQCPRCGMEKTRLEWRRVY